MKILERERKEKLAVASPAPTGLTDKGWFLDAATPGELAAYDACFYGAINAIEDILSGKDKGEGSGGHEAWQATRKKLLDLVAAKTPLAPAQAAEPVAFLVRGYCEKGKLYAGVLHQDVEDAKRTASEFAKHYPTVKIVGLYTHPAPVPLTKESAWNLAMRVYSERDPYAPPEEQILLTPSEIKKIIETAYGIKE